MKHNDSPQEIMLNKFVAKSGLCSRRKAAELIKAGKIKVNDKPILEPFYRVQTNDTITHQGEQLHIQEKLVYLLMNKPKNVITTTSDPKGRKTVMEILGNKYDQRLFPVGRLDRNTTGLLLITNDGDLAKKLAHPSHNIKKLYHVELDKPVTDEHIAAIKAGLSLEDGIAEVDRVAHLSGKTKHHVGIEIHIGRNRIVRRIFEHLDYQVTRLDRVRYAGLTKKNLKRGWSRELDEQEIIMLKHFN